MKKDSAILSLVNKDPGSGRALDVDFWRRSQGIPASHSYRKSSGFL